MTASEALKAMKIGMPVLCVKNPSYTEKEVFSISEFQNTIYLFWPEESDKPIDVMSDDKFLKVYAKDTFRCHV